MKAQEEKNLGQIKELVAQNSQSNCFGCPGGAPYSGTEIEVVGRLNRRQQARERVLATGV